MARLNSRLLYSHSPYSHSPNPHLPFERDARDPNFARDALVWAAQTQQDIRELVTATRHTIATTRALMAEADRLIAHR